MAPKDVERRLAAILSADVKGYSRLIREDEEATVRTLTAYREVMASLIQQRRGRVVDSLGDNLLAEFSSVVDAVQCTVEIQRALNARNEELPVGRRMKFRIGINLGDVIVEGERLYGDGVNVAARLEALAEPGGICISSKVFEEVRNKLEVGFEDLGEQEVKNITEPVRVYRVKLDGDGPRPESSASDPSRMQQEIRFCTTSDGVRIAYSTVGQGPPLVKTANWLTWISGREPSRFFSGKLFLGSSALPWQERRPT